MLIDNIKLVDKGTFREGAFRELLLGARYPARNPDLNLADIRAQIAANNKVRIALLLLSCDFNTVFLESYPS